MFRFKAVALSVVLVLPASAAQSQEQVVSRLERIGRYLGEAPVCEGVGFKLTSESERLSVSALATADAVKAGLSKQEADAYVARAVREASEATSGAYSALGQLDIADGPRFIGAVTSQMRKWVTNCRQIAADPIGAALVIDAPESDDDLVRKSSDDVLVTAGWASWQTPYIRQGGILAYTVGACSKHLTPAKTAAYMTEINAPNHVPAGAKDRARAYFVERMQRGKSKASTGVTAKTCTEFLQEDSEALRATLTGGE